MKKAITQTDIMREVLQSPLLRGKYFEALNHAKINGSTGRIFGKKVGRQKLTNEQKRIASIIYQNSN